MSAPTLYAISGSHACRSATLMLDHKGLGYRRVDLPTGMHPLLVRLLGFPGHPAPIRRVDGQTHRMLALLDRGGTVPALRWDGQRIQTNHDIARFLDRLKATPPLLPADPPARSAVEEAERWGDEVFQMAARRVALAAAAAKGLDAFHERGSSGPLGPLLDPRESVRRFASRGASVSFRANRANEQELAGALPAMFDRIDTWIAEGVIGGDDLNAADFMIVPSLALLAYLHEQRPAIAARPAGELLTRVLPGSLGGDRVA